MRLPFQTSQGQVSTSGRHAAPNVEGNVWQRSKRRHAHLVRAETNSAGVVTLLDYGAGNVRSVRNAIKQLGYTLKEVRKRFCTCSSSLFLEVWHLTVLKHIWICMQVEKPSDILAAEKLLFPGVGAFEQAMGALKDRGYVEALQEYIKVMGSR